MNQVRLVHLINDSWDAVERSKVGEIYVRDKEGNIIKNADGAPWVNSVAVAVFQNVLSAQIIRGNIHEN